MGLFANIAKRIQSAFTPPRADAPPDRIIDFFAGWQTGNIAANWTQNRLELVNQFRGWPYIAIKSICEEIACLTAQVCRIADGREVRSELNKSLARAKSFQEREELRARYRGRFLLKSMRRKALAHLQDGDELEPVSSDHDLVKLLQNPNGPDVSWSFFYRLFMYLELTGSSYIWIVQNRTGKPCQLWVIPSHWVREFPTDVNGQPTDKLVGSYEIRPVTGPASSLDYGAGWFPGMGGTKRVDESEIIKITYPSPLSLVDGYAPGHACGAWVDISNAISSSRVQSFYNGAFPGVILQLDREATVPDQPTLERIYARFAEKAVGVRNSRKPYVLSPGLTLAPSPWQSPVEMDHVNSETQSRDALLAVYRVGPTIAGITEQTSFAADTAARLGFYHSTLKPKLMLLGQIMTEKLAPRFEKDLIVYWPDPTPDDPEYKLKVSETLSRLSAMTPNEVREDQGKEPFEFGGDDPMGSMGQQPLPWATGEQPMGAMDGGSLPSEAGAEAGAEDGQSDPMDDVMSQLLGGDGASEQPGIPTPLANRMNGNGVNGHAH